MKFRKRIAFFNLPTCLLYLIAVYIILILWYAKMFAAFNFVCLIAGKESSSTFLSRCGVKCRWRAGSDFPLRKESNKPSYMSSGCTSWSNREINKSLVCFILLIFLITWPRLLFTEGNNTGSWPEKRKKCWKNNHSLTFICRGNVG